MNAMTTCTAVVVLTAASMSAAPQLTKTVQGESKTATVTVEAIQKTTREVMVKRQDGTTDVFYVPPTVKRFDTLKVGDKINARYYETMVLQLKKPGEKDVDTAASATSQSPANASGTAAFQQKATVTITAIDPKVPSITFSGPRGWSYSSRVEDTKALSKVKVGDKVDITWTEALILSIEDGK
jgi:hypothetical protein